MKKFIQLKLKVLAKMILAKYKPEVICITGSVGKTGAREAIYTVLADKFKVRRSEKNYNNEIGVPLTIIGAESPGRNLLGWLLVFLKAFTLALFKDRNYPKILILEMGVDKPGDMDYLLSIARPRIAVLTMIGTVHAEFFGSVSKLRQEKAKLIKSARKTGWSIINYDNKECRQIMGESKVRVITYGLGDKADINARGIQYSYQGEKTARNIQGISFKLNYKSAFISVILPDVLGINVVYAVLAAVAVGITKDISPVQSLNALNQLSSFPGRMKLIDGVKNTIIVDDTYNAEPSSTIAALGALRRITIESNGKKYAILGDMLELGSYSEEAHKNVGRYIARTDINKLIVVGERSRDIARGAEEAGMSKDNIFHFDDADSAGKFIQDRIREGDLILIKGSQGMRMEKIVKEIMAEPMRAEELLVRQGREWRE